MQKTEESNQKQNKNYDNSEQGAWKVTKSAKWISKGKARITFDVDSIEMNDNKDRDIYKYAEFVESLISEEDKSKFTISYLDNKTMAAKEFYDKVKSKSVHLGDKTVNNFKRLFQCMEVI